MCPETKFENELFSFINENVIDVPKKKISEIYSFWRGGSPDLKIDPKEVYVQNKSSISLSQGVPDGACFLGVDFPTWFDKSNNQNNKKKIIILGIDPLRNKAVFDHWKAIYAEDVIIGTPYALHDLKMRDGRQKNYWTLIETLSEDNFVYLTDIYKTFFYTDQSKRTRSYIYYENKLIAHHIELVKKEIKLIKPDLIITFGRISFAKLMGKSAPKLVHNIEKTTAVFESEGEKYPVLPMVHLSAWKKNKLDFLRENGITDGDIVRGYCQIVNSYLKKS